MAANVDMSLDDIIKSRKRSERGKGQGRVRRGRAPGRPFNGGRMQGTARRGPLAVNARPSSYSIAKNFRTTRSIPWQHDLFEDSLKAAGISGIEIGTKVFVSNLHPGVTNEDIRELFSEIGELKRYAIHYGQDGRPSGSAEVVYVRRSDAFAALKRYNNVLLDGKPMKIEIVGGNTEVPVSARVNVTGINGRNKRTVVMTPGRGRVGGLPPINSGFRRFILVHVMPTITAIPTPSGDFISVAELDENLVRLYVEDVKLKVEEIFIPYIKLCKRKETETIVLEDDCPAAALLRFVSEAAIDCLVLGSCSTNFITRKLKGPGVPTTVLGCVPNSCNVYVVSKHGIITKSADLTSSSESSSSPRPRSYGESSSGFIESLHELHDSSVKRVQETPGLSSVSENSYPNSHALVLTCSPTRTSLDISQKFGNNLQPTIFEQHHETWPTSEQAEMEQLRQELQTTLEMYERACEELVHTENKVQLLTYECLGEARRATNALEREKQLREIAANVKEKHLQALKEVENAKALLLKEAQERERAELKAQKEFLEKKELIDTLLLSDKRYRRYTVTEIEIATNFFSETNIIGEGGYGKVYKCNLDHTPVAVKVLCPDAADKKDEFLTEVEVLSQLQHPHIVLLLGACPENRCLIYEFMDNGSLDEYVFRENGKPPLPWFVRFRIVYEVACALAFLHNSKPEPIVHRDMKPGNILLDKNYTSKIGDIGLAKLIDDVVPDNITEYRGSVLAGTIHYMDPEYHRTGTVRPKSDLYALGVIILQMLTARQPNRLLLIVENAINDGSFADIVDKSITDWPLGETEELAQIALKCSNLRCRDRPDLDTEVLPLLRRLKDFAGTGAKLEKCSISAPSHFFCPILQEVMEDPYIAADGFSYEHGAIKAWLERQNASPVTKVKLQHSMLIPDCTLRSAIQEWKSPRKHSGSF